jgi:hypothetical protein
MMNPLQDFLRNPVCFYSRPVFNPNRGLKRTFDRFSAANPNHPVGIDPRLLFFIGIFPPDIAGKTGGPGQFFFRVAKYQSI